ncbi:MAG: carboxypeptidase-like regulatory domain-containing protein [Terracidiphilus sp.]
MSFIRSAVHDAVGLLAGVLISGVAFAQAQNAQPPSVAANALSGPYRIAGIVVNAATGDPVRRATVEALNEDDSRAVASCRTDNDGRFALERLAEAKYQLTASKRGFRTAFYDEHDEYATSIVTGPDQDTSHLQFKLTPGAVLHGVVTGNAGEPVAEARVMLFKGPKHPGAGERIAQADTALTDDTGAYEFGDIAAGEYLLAVTAEPWYAVHEGSPAKRNAALDVAYPVTYFDSTTEEGSATPIMLAGGSREEANISLHALPALHLSISAPRKPDGSTAVPQIQETIFGNAIPSEVASGTTDTRFGTTEIGGIAPGHYELTQGDPPRIVDLDLTTSQQVEANAGSAADAAEGRVRMVTGAPVPEEITLSLVRMSDGVGQSMYAAQAQRGRFKFDAVPPGQWALAATNGNKALPVVAVNAGGVQRPGNIVTLPGRAPDLVVTLSDAEARVEGFARKDGKGFAGAMIVLLPKNPAQWRALTRRDQSDSDGSFALRGVAPGEYTVIAIEDGWPLDWTSPAAMARYLPRATSVTVSDTSGTLIRLSSPITVQMR